jgi:hypothetical protein
VSSSHVARQKGSQVLAVPAVRLVRAQVLAR